MNPKGIIIHHSLTEDNGTVSWGAIRRYHMEVNGWQDNGYHYGIEKVGDGYEIFKGRMDNTIGAHCLSFNNYIGICLVGNYDLEPPCPAQLALLKKICDSLMAIYGFKITDIFGHWETYGLRNVPVEKSCPGNKFNMVEFRKSL